MQIIKYKWAPNTHLPKEADVQAIGERLTKLQKEAGGNLKVEAVLEDARSPHSPQHVAFEWTDKAAAHEYRKQQAGYLLRNIRAVMIVTPNSEPIEVHVFVSLRSDSDGGYRTMVEILSDSELQEEMLQEARADLESWLRKYRHLSKLLKLVGKVSQLLLEMQPKIEA